MKKTLLISLALFIFCLCGNALVAHAQTPFSVDVPKVMGVVPGVLYIQLKAKHGIDFEHISPTHTGSAELDKLFAGIGVNDIYPFDADAKNYGVSRRHGIDRMYVINFPEEGSSPREISAQLLNMEAIEAVSPRFLFQKCIVPNDPAISQQYALDNMHLKDAWGISLGSSNIVIADVDEGVNYNHEDLSAHIHKIGNFFGYDVVGDGNARKFHPDNDPMPINGQSHGTNTSGCFGEVPDNGKGGAGSGYNCMIMAIRASDSAGFVSGGYEGIHYATTHGAKIINCSWGGGLSLKNSSDRNFFAYAQTLIDEARDTGALVVASAGNSGLNIDDTLFVPASLRGVLSVGATDQNDAPATQGFNSNYGHSVYVYAPGVSVFTTDFPGNSSYSAPSGTSFSCPLTSGVAGLVWAKNPQWTPNFVLRQITESVDNDVKPADRKHYWGRVNAYSALTKQTVPGLMISDFKIDGVDKGGLNFQNKTYQIDVTFKNSMAAGAGIQAQLLSVPGTGDPSLPLYTIQQSFAPLGSMSSLQETEGFFKFTRDTNDDGPGSQLTLAFAISYGTATVHGDKYYDTLVLNIDITGDNNYTAGVANELSNILQLGNTFPNPVSGDATISFELAKRSYGKLSVCDVLGRTTSILSDGIFDEGIHPVHFDARTMENGVYIYKLETSDGAVMTKRMIVIH